MAAGRLGGPDMIKLQQTIMQNSQNISDYMQDLSQWTTDIKQKEAKTVYGGAAAASSGSKAKLQ